MGLYDRDYTQQDYRPRDGYSGVSLRSLFPKPPNVVLRIIIINTVIFLATVISGHIAGIAVSWFSVFPQNLFTAIQLWRPITYQFLHAGLGHILWNMLWLYFFGSILERLWGPRKFLIFYLTCGAVGGIVYSMLALLGVMSAGALVGASGAIFGIVIVVAILFPKLRVYVWGIFPIPMMLLALICILVSLLGLRGENAGGDLCHLAGAAAGAIYVFSESWRAKWKLRFKAAKWQKDVTAERKLRIEVDRILKKVHDHGIHALTTDEKRILKKATKREQIRPRP